MHPWPPRPIRHPSRSPPPAHTYHHATLNSTSVPALSFSLALIRRGSVPPAHLRPRTVALWLVLHEAERLPPSYALPFRSLPPRPPPPAFSLCTLWCGFDEP